MTETEVPTPVEAPPEVVDAMQSCHKPFQLWNVKREEIEYDYELQPQPKFSVGSGATLAEDEQVPWNVPRASQVLKSLMEQAEMDELMARGHADWFKHVLRDELPFGKPDPTPEEEAGKLIRWDPLSGEPPPPGVRLPPGFGPPS